MTISPEDVDTIVGHAVVEATATRDNLLRELFKLADDALAGFQIADTNPDALAIARSRVNDIIRAIPADLRARQRNSSPE